MLPRYWSIILGHVPAKPSPIARVFAYFFAFFIAISLVALPSSAQAHQSFEHTEGSISGTVFDDVNGNGIHDAGEPGVAGVTIRLLRIETDTRVVGEVETDAKGRYRFEGLEAGHYRVVEVEDPPNSTSTTPNEVEFDLAENEHKVVNFGDQLLGDLGGTVFEDVNGNGIQDAGESGIANVAIVVRNASGDVVANLQTDANGAYTEPNLPTGHYTLFETDPANFVSTTPNNRAAVVTHNTITTVNFGDHRSNSITGIVFEDRNGNGRQDASEPGIAGVNIRLLRIETDTRLVDEVQTDANGVYRFEDLQPGRYKALETDPANYASSTPNLRFVILIDGGAATANFGDVPVDAVFGIVFEDHNGNGRQDAGEPGINNVAVQLLQRRGQLIQDTSTDANGFYRFDNVQPGVYRVAEIVPDGYIVVSRNPRLVVVGSKHKVAVANFGNMQIGAISGVVFEDRNGNRRQDDGELGIPGVTITLFNAHGASMLDDATTDANGSYQFTARPAGKYRVRETDPPGYTSTTSNVRTVRLHHNSAASANFGDQPQGAIVGVVFDDQNGNGEQDQGEPGLANVAVQLRPRRGGASQNTTTNADGSYGFTNLDPGRYRVIETDPLNFASTTPNRVPVNLAAGGAAVANFGDRPQNQIGGQVFQDLNGNKIVDAGETGLAGVDVMLVRRRGFIVQSTTTDSGGYYAFDDVSRGAYRVTVDGNVGEDFVLISPDPVSVYMLRLGTAAVNFAAQQIQTIVGAGEPGGQVTLLANTPGAPVLQTLILGPDGSFQFTDVAAGNYTLNYTAPEGFTALQDQAGVSLPANGATSASFATLPDNSVAGVAYLDSNGNGSRDQGEPGIAGVVVELRQGNTLVHTTTTTVAGGYLFLDVANGAYSVHELDPDGFTSTTPNVVNVNLTEQSLVAQVDFGDLTTGSIGGIVFYDANGNGVQDPDESLLSGVTVEILSNDNEEMSAGADGMYYIDEIDTGSYTVRVVPLPGLVNTTSPAVNITLDNANTTGSASFGLFVDELTLFLPAVSGAAE